MARISLPEVAAEIFTELPRRGYVVETPQLTDGAHAAMGTVEQHPLSHAKTATADAEVRFLICHAAALISAASRVAAVIFRAHTRRGLQLRAQRVEASAVANSFGKTHVQRNLHFSR